MQEQQQPEQQSEVALAMAAFLKDQLKEGELYVGMILSEGGIPSHHLILLPGDIERNWTGAMAWAAEIGGYLPTRTEQVSPVREC